ncbi:GTP-binding protein [uncultured Duncaniella sp.]|uniref:GTP-binding protein n=1 Tax=uncultured Duncaniella sp. TaxID=2768039 RepID=UPI0025D5E34F|nr:GTP-binding protein [uncultured Duncaniella sp.]
MSTPVLLLTGYLGSGKTTLVNHILTNERGIRFAVIVNDIGEVNIDADLIQRGGIVDSKDDSLVALQNGCICCTLKMDLVKQLDDIMAMGKFDYIVIEASGICEPAPIAQTICSIPQMGAEFSKHGLPKLDCIATVVDALRMQDEFSCGEDLTAKKHDEEDIANLVIQQIEFCNIIVLNKISEVTETEKGRIRTIIKALNPGARIIECDYADVNIEDLINTHLFNFNKVATSAAWVQEIEKPIEQIEEEERAHHHHHHHDEEEHEHHHHEHDDDDDDDHDECECHHHHHDDDEHEHDGHEHHHHEHGEGCTCGCHHHHHHHHGEGEAEEYGIGSFVYFRRHGFDLNKFDYFAANKWPKSIIRSKGICYFGNNPDMSYLFESAGRQKQLREAGMWFATAPEDELKELVEQDPGIMRDWDDDYGDRMIKIVFIGQNLDRKAITEALDACLDL